MTKRRIGDWMQTYTGLQFWPLDPEPQDVNIWDIAHALANICRFNGHCIEFYSVAQHSVLVSRIIPEEHALWGLLHDAAEAYIGDMIRPLKISMPSFKDAELRIEQAIAARFSLDWPMPAAIKKADNKVLATEQRDVMAPTNQPWDLKGATPLRSIISPVAPNYAEKDFLDRYFRLTQRPEEVPQNDS